MKTETRSIEDLLPDPNNINKHTQRGHGLVENSIRRRGVGRGILAAGKNTEKPVIMAGNLTHEKAMAAGIEEVVFVHTTGNQLVVNVRDDIDPTSPEAIALGIEDNEAGKLSYNPDIDLLAEMAAGDNGVLSKLKEDDKIFGDMLAGMGVKGEEPVDAEPQIDRAAELQEKWQTATGQLWKLGDHRLLIGDCTVRENVERLMGGEKVDIVFSDIPYGIDYSGGRTQVVRHKPYGKIEGDDIKDVSVFVYPLLELGATDNWVCCSPVNLAPALRPFDERGGVNAIIVWDKKSPGLGYQWVRRQTEFILFETKRKKPKDENSEFDLWSISRDDTNEYIHGNQKPIELVIRALSFSRNCGNNVADLFAGSGSTLIGAQNVGMRCFAMEKTESTGAVILERFFTATGITPELVE